MEQQSPGLLMWVIELLTSVGPSWCKRGMEAATGPGADGVEDTGSRSGRLGLATELPQLISE